MESVKLPVEVEGTTVDVNASIGITMSGNAENAKQLVEIADKAMYQAKRRNKGVCLLDGSRKIFK